MCRRRRVLALVPCRCAINAHREIVVAEARLKHTTVVVRRHIPVATHHVVDVLAVARCVRACARAEAELVVADEARPLVVLECGAERVAVNETTNWVTVAVRAMRVELASLIAVRDVQAREVTHARHLNVVWRLNEVHAMECAIRNCARAPAALCAPGDLLPLRVPDSALARRCPQAEIINIVDPRRLAVRGLRGGGAAVVRACLAVFRLARK